MTAENRPGIVLSLLSVACGLACAGLCLPGLSSSASALAALRDPRLFGSLAWLLFAACAGRSYLVVRGPDRRTASLTAIFLTLLSAAISFLRLPSPSAAPVAYLLSLLLAARLCGPTAFAVLAGLCVTLHAGLLAGLGEPSLLVVYLMEGALASGLGLAAHADMRDWRRQSELFDQARWAASAFVKTNLRMQDNVDRIASHTQMEERLWMSRELHDSIGYTLTAALAQVVASQKVIAARSEDAARLIERLKGIEDMIRETLQDMRRRVSALRGGAAMVDNGSPRWIRLCRAFADSTGVRVQWAIPQDLATVTEEVSDAVYRVIQECLTNAYRHGNADLVDVSAAWDPETARLLLRVSDNGKGAAGDLAPGNGLRGMRERIEGLKGEVVWQTAPGRGFSVGAVVPWRGNPS